MCLQDESYIVDNRMCLGFDIIVHWVAVIILDWASGDFVSLGRPRAHSTDKQQISNPMQVRVCTDC